MMVLIFALAACSKSNEAGTKEIKTKLMDGDEIIIKGVGKPFEPSDSTTVALNEGKASIKMQVKNSEKDIYFDVALFPEIEGNGSVYSLVTVDGNGDFSKEEKFEVPKKGDYTINIHMDGNVQDDFKAEWKVVINQKPQKDSKYKKQLRLAEVDQVIGGRMDSMVTGETGYGSVVRDFKVLGSDSVSFLTYFNDHYYKTELKNGKWKTIEEETGNPLDELEKIRESHSDFDSLLDLNTSKGEAKLITYGGKYYIFYEDVTIPQEEIALSEEFLANKELMDSDSVYWDQKKKMVYSVVDEEGDKVIYRYDLNKNKIVRDEKGEVEATPLPFDEEIVEPVRFATDKDGNVYVAALVSDEYRVLLTAYDKEMKMIAKPITVTSIYENYDKGKFVIVATNNGVDIWNVFDERIVNGYEFSGPTKIGVNRHSIVLQ